MTIFGRLCHAVVTQTRGRIYIGTAANTKKSLFSAGFEPDEARAIAKAILDAVEQAHAMAEA